MTVTPTASDNEVTIILTRTLSLTRLIGFCRHVMRSVLAIAETDFRSFKKVRNSTRGAIRRISADMTGRVHDILHDGA
jgi:hypothetical protein